MNKNFNNKKKVLMVQGLHEEGKKLLLQRDDIEPITIMSANEDEILEVAKEVHGITVRTANITRKIIENSKNLQVISRHGVGYDSIDVDALNDCGIPLAIAAHSNMISVAEHAMFMLLALSKNVFYYDQFARKADWTTRWDIRAWDVAEKKLLVIGFGRIGSRLVKRALAFDMKVFVYDPYVDELEIKKSGANHVNNYLDILHEMDAVSLHCPKNEETTNMFSENEFKIMKESAFLINCARGGIINEVALLDALKSNKIRAAGLDVYDDEPSTSSNPLFSLDNILLLLILQELLKRQQLGCLNKPFKTYLMYLMTK